MIIIEQKRKHIFLNFTFYEDVRWYCYSIDLFSKYYNVWL